MAPTRERWTSTLVDAARAIGDAEQQCARWLSPDAFAWERPEELINMWDDLLIDAFIEEHGACLSRAQADAAVAFRNELDNYCKVTPDSPNPQQVLTDPRWEAVRSKARAFVAAFETQ